MTSSPRRVSSRSASSSGSAHCRYDDSRSLRRQRCGNAANCRASATASRKRAAGRDQTVRQPHAARLVAGHAAPGEDQIERVAVAEQTRQADRAAVDQRHAPAPAIDAEHRILGGDTQVAPRRQLEAAGDRVPLDRRDHRLRQQHARRAHRTVAVEIDAVATPARHALEVGPGAERAAGAGQYRDREPDIGLEAPERGGQRRGGRPIDRVAHRRAVDGDDGDRTVGLEMDGVGHRASSQLGSTPERHEERGTRNET